MFLKTEIGMVEEEFKLRIKAKYNYDFNTITFRWYDSFSELKSGIDRFIPQSLDTMRIGNYCVYYYPLGRKPGDSLKIGAYIKEIPEKETGAEEQKGNKILFKTEIEKVRDDFENYVKIECGHYDTIVFSWFETYEEIKRETERCLPVLIDTVLIRNYYVCYYIFKRDLGIFLKIGAYIKEIPEKETGTEDQKDKIKGVVPFDAFRPAGSGDENAGVKFDADKIRMDLLPFDVLLEVSKVLTYGANKYSANNWQTVPDAVPCYQAAMLRHFTAYKNGEQNDKESNLSHAAHVATNALFLLWFELNKNLDKEAGRNKDL